LTSFFGELKRRNVVKVAVAYAIVGWVLVQIADTFFPALQLPEWTVTLVAGLVILGFPLALILSWAYELTPDGMERTKSVPLSESIANVKGRKLDFVIIGVLAIAVAFFAVERFILEEPSETEIVADEPVEGSPPVVVEEQREVLPNSVAVLPFENLSLDPEDAYFAAGIHEEILNQLAKISALNVIARTSMMQYAAGDKSIPQVAEELNVETVMEGSVRYADGRVLVTAQLIDPATNAHLWSDSYNREFADIFAIQADIAINIANALEAEFSLVEKEDIERSPTNSPEAYELYLRGRYFWNIRTEQAIEAALDYFRQAVQLDSNYALAYSGIADVWIFRGWYSVLAPKETFPSSKTAILEALAIDEGLAEAHASRAHIYLEFDHDWPAAGREYRRAIELNPRYSTAHHWYGGYLSAMERHEEALEQALEARRLEPLSLIINTWVGLRHYFAGRYETAIEEIENALALNPNFAPGHWHLGWAYEQAGRYADAISSAERAYAISENPIYLASLGHAFAMAGDDEQAREVLARLQQISMTQHVSAYHTAVVYVALGDVDGGFLWLDRALEEQSPWTGYMKVDPRLRPLRSDSRFDALLRQARLD